MSLSLVSGKLAFLHDGYIVAIENCCAPTAVKRTLMPTRVASLLLAQEKINISACVNGIPYINGAREMGVHERIASVT